MKSVDLLGNTPQLNSPWYDRIFILARHCLEDGAHHFIIDDATPVARLNDKVDVNAPLVADIKNDPTYCLVSANACLYIEDYGYLAIRRDGGAPVYPHHYTVPAGRCEQDPYQTAISELNQELCIKLAEAHGVENQAILGFGDWSVARRGLFHKEKHMDQKLGALMVVNLINRPSPLDEPYIFEVNGAMSGSQATIVYDQATNCYELCYQFMVKLPKNWKIDGVWDGDGFGRSVEWIQSLNQLADRPCVPALREMIVHASKAASQVI